MNLTWFMAWYMINGALNHVGFRASHAPYMVRGGERGIRTLGPDFSRNTRFPIVPLRPLGHLSSSKRLRSTCYALVLFFLKKP
jgi:hypothetical protein